MTHCATIYSRLMHHTRPWEKSSESSLILRDLAESAAAFRERVIQVESAQNPGAITLSESLDIPVVSALLAHTLAELRRRKMLEEAFASADIERISWTESFFNQGIEEVINLLKESEETLAETARKADPLPPPREEFSNTPAEGIEKLEEKLLGEMYLFLRLDEKLSMAQEAGDSRQVDKITRVLGMFLEPLEDHLLETARAHVHRQAASPQRLSLP